jgi:hypothetical protein
MNMGKFLRDNLGKHITINQTAGASSGKGNLRQLLPEGEFRTFRFTTPNTAVTGIANVTGGEFDKLNIQGHSGSVKIRKNEPVRAALATVYFEAGPTGPAPRTITEMPPFAKFAIANPPTIDGGQPRAWNYAFDIAVDGDLHSLRLRPLSTALRSKNLPKPLPILGPTEELTLLAPVDWLNLTAKANQGPVTGVIEAEFTLRDFPELGPPAAGRLSVTLPMGSFGGNKASPVVEVARNSKCRCGSGRKYKYCHGR